MAPLPVSNTDRWRYTYQNAIAEHTVMFRLLDGSGVADADNVFNAIISYFDDLVALSTVTLLEFAPSSSDIFNPIGGSDIVGTEFGVNTANPTTNSVGATFVGRSPDARRTRFTIFGWFGAVSDYRLTTGEDANLEPLIAFLNDPGTPIIGIGGLGPIFKAYIDIKANDHWVKEAR